MRLALFALFFGAVTVGATDLIQAIELQETGAWATAHRDRLVGDHGQAHGRYQFHRRAWEDVSRARRAHGLAAYGFADAHNAVRAREYALGYIEILKSRLGPRSDEANVLRAWKGLRP